jgi:hypothetical protein
VRFTHHAKNRLRKVKGTTQEAESVVADQLEKDFDPKGNPRYRGFIAGKRCAVIVALDDPDVIITVFEKERG